MSLIVESEEMEESVFDWHSYFEGRSNVTDIPEKTMQAVFLKVRNLLKEDSISMTFSFTGMMRDLLQHVNIPENLRILELGAGTGFLSRWFLDEYGGKALLVDKNKSSYQAYQQGGYDDMYSIEYRISDAYLFKVNRSFDLVCSFGLIEHFKDKCSILGAHKRFLTRDGYVVILVPMDSLLTKIYFEVHPELNLGYRELLSKKEFVVILEENGLEIINITNNAGYSYDIMAALCKSRQSFA